MQSDQSNIFAYGLASAKLPGNNVPLKTLIVLLRNYVWYNLQRHHFFDTKKIICKFNFPTASVLEIFANKIESAQSLLRLLIYIGQ